MSTTNVTYRLPALNRMSPVWTMIEDCVEGESRIKSAGDTYLPRPNPEDKSAANNQRFDSYKARAVFYNVTGRTLRGFVGQVFSQDPATTIDKSLDVLFEDVDGAGTGLIQQSKATLSNVIAYGRCGLLADYPVRDSATTRAELLSGVVHATITLYAAKQVINWRTALHNGRKRLVLVVLEEVQTSTLPDEFEPTVQTVYRVLKLVNGVYTVQLWEQSEGTYRGGPITTPLDGGGRPFAEIPFTFIGSENNDSEPNVPPLGDLASLNIAHYRNSADYEEACYMLGQPTPWFSGLTEQWVKDVLQGRVVLGSRASVPLPVGASAGILQVSPNTMPKEAMEAKERQMVALGARLAQQAEVQRTATEAKQERSAEVSTLVSSAKNVSAAYTRVLRWVSMFHGLATDNVEFVLNERFAMSQLPPDEQNALVASWQAGAIGFEEVRAEFRSAGIAFLNDEKVKSEGEANKALDPMAPAPTKPPVTK